jgi:septal ring-binding cell division protein DamX
MSMRSFVLCLALLAAGPAGAQTAPVYRCPGPPIEYTDQITPQQAQARNCRTIENAPVTIVAPTNPRPVAAGTPPSASAQASRPGARVDPADQRARDSDARKILESELQKEEAALAGLQKEFNNGEPDRLGSERNYQRYLDRVEEMRAAIARKQADIAAVKRELAKLPAQRPE